MKFVKYLICLVFTLSFTFACSTNLEKVSTATSQLKAQNLDLVIDSSYDLLVAKGLEPAGLSYDTADAAVVQFPSGDQGVFVTIGAFGIARGYQLLYRVAGEQFELIEPIRTGRYVWGLKSLQNEKRGSAQVDIEMVDIIAQRHSEWQAIVKVTGAGHAGSGLWDDGYFEILAVTETGLQELFAGVEFSTDSTTVDRYQAYKFTDLDGDGTQEIMVAVENCEYRVSQDSEQREDLGCQQSQAVYKFDGTRYVSE